MKAFAVGSLLMLTACGGGSDIHDAEAVGVHDMAVTNNGDDLARDQGDDGDVAGSPDLGGDKATLIKKGTYTLAGQTAAGLLLVIDATQELSALDPATGTLTAIAKADGGAFAIGDVVFVEHDVEEAGLSQLGVWTEAGGYHDLGQMGVYPTSAITDGTHIAFVANFSVSTFAGNLILDNVTHTNPKTLVTAQETYVDQFVTGGKVFATHGKSGSSGTATLFDATSAAGVDLTATVGPLGVVNAQGTAAVVTVASDTQEILDLTTSDKIQLPSNLRAPQFSGDGKTLFAPTTSNGLVSVTWSGTSASVSNNILSANVLGVSAVSGDGKAVLYYSNYSSGSSDLRLVTVATPSSDRSLIASGAISPSFTPDSAYVTFHVDTNLDVAAVAGGAATRVSATANRSQFYGKDKLLITDNEMANGTHYNADIELVDLATPLAATTKLLSQVDATSFVANDGATFYYVDTTMANAGIYKLTLP